MSDYDNLKKMLEDAREIKAGLSVGIERINEMFETFEDMNSDCDDELEEIDDTIESLREDLIDGEGDEDEINKDIESLIQKRKLVEEAVDLLDELQSEFTEIAEIADTINIG
jgi:chromosome segregation ATPase